MDSSSSDLALRETARALIGSLVSGRWPTGISFLRNLGLAVGFLIVVVPLVGGLAYLLGGNAMGSTLGGITPKTGLELVVWLGLAATGGFCEEVVFRGYLTRQFSTWTGSHALGVVLQGIAFGLAHGYYRKLMLVVMIQGWLLGLLAYWRKSLRPGMLAHVLQDAAGGFVAFLSRQ